MDTSLKFFKEMADSQETINALMAQKLTNIDKSITEINDKLDDKYVTKEEFGLVQKIVFGEVAMILISVLGYLISLAVKH